MRWLLQKTTKRSLYRKSLITILLITCIPIAVMGAVLYGVGSNRILQEVNASHQKQLHQTVQRFDDYLSQLELFVGRLTLEPSFNSSLEDTDFIQQFQKKRDIDQSLSLMRSTNPLIQEVSLYIQKSNTFMSDETGYRQLSREEDRAYFSGLLKQDRDITWHHEVRYPTSAQPRQAIVVKLKRTIYDQEAYGAFIVYINQRFMNQYLNNVTSEDGYTALREKRGATVAVSYNASRPAPFTDAILEQAESLAAEPHTTTARLAGERYSISYAPLSRFGQEWVYISATPLSAIMQPVESISTLILIVSSSGIALALVLSWVASERLYRPVRRLLHLFQRDAEPGSLDEAAYIEKRWIEQLSQKQELERKLQDATPSMREGFLMQLLQGHLYYLQEGELLDRLKLLEWDVGESRFAFLVFQLSGIFGKPQFSSKDEQLITFAQYNIVQETCSAWYDKYFVLNNQDLSVGVMIAVPWESGEAEIRERLRDMAEQTTSSLSVALKLRVTVAIGNLADSIVEAPDRLEEARNALQYRDLNEHNQVLQLDCLHAADGRSVTYPFEIEKSLLHALRSGDEEGAKRNLRLFMKNIQSQSGLNLVVQNALVKLLGSIHEALLKAGINMIELYKDTNLYEELMQLKEMDERVEWFEQVVFAPYLSAVQNSQELQLRNIVQQMIQHMEQHYAQELTFESIADTYGIHMTRLSRAFKAATGLTYTEYLTRLRLDKCKELLEQSDMKINDIAEMLGYQPAYLIRIFKKQELVTPGQYRELHRANASSGG